MANTYNGTMGFPPNDLGLGAAVANSYHGTMGFPPTDIVPAIPNITGVNPGQGTTAGGIPITIPGSGFEAAQGLGFVQFGGVNALAYAAWADNQIICTLPPGAAGFVNVFVQNNTGNSDTLVNGFQYIGGGADAPSGEPRIGLALAIAIGL